MKTYHFWSLPDTIYEVPDNFNRNDRTLNNTFVDIIVRKNGTSSVRAMNHRVLAECMGRDRPLGIGYWKCFKEH